MMVPTTTKTTTTTTTTTMTTTRTTTTATTTRTRTRTRTRRRRRTRSNNNNDDNNDNDDDDNDDDDNEDAARSMSCPQVQMKSPSLFPSPDPYRHRRCAKLYNNLRLPTEGLRQGHGLRPGAGARIFGLTPLVGSAGPLGPPFHRSVGVKVTEWGPASEIYSLGFLEHICWNRRFLGEQVSSRKLLRRVFPKELLPISTCYFV